MATWAADELRRTAGIDLIDAFGGRGQGSGAVGPQRRRRGEEAGADQGARRLRRGLQRLGLPLFRRRRHLERPGDHHPRRSAARGHLVEHQRQAVHPRRQVRDLVLPRQHLPVLARQQHAQVLPLDRLRPHLELSSHHVERLLAIGYRLRSDDRQERKRLLFLAGDQWQDHPVAQVDQRRIEVHDVETRPTHQRVHQVADRALVHARHAGFAVFAS